MLEKLLNIKDKYGSTALITGACSGIGKAFAFGFAQDGINLILLSNNQSRLNETEKQLSNKFKVEVKSICCDLAEINFLDKIEDHLKNEDVDILVNSASFGQLEPFYETPLKKHIDCINISINSYLLLTHKYLKGMKEREKGALIFVSSVNSFAPVGYSSVYTSSKSFELSFGQSLWKELKDEKSKVDCLVLCPAATKTNFQSTAGTKVADWAWEPEKVVSLAMRKLGKSPQAISTWRGLAYYYITKFLPRRLAIHFATWAINSNLRKD